MVQATKRRRVIWVTCQGVWLSAVEKIKGSRSSATLIFGAIGVTKIDLLNRLYSANKCDFSAYHCASAF